MKKRILVLLLSACMLIGVLTVFLSASVGAETPSYYAIDAAREGDVYYVTVRCNWEEFTMLNGEFVFTYPTDEWELLVEDRTGPIDPANSLTRLPGAEVGVDKAAGEIRLAFMSIDGVDFSNGWVTMLVLPFRAVSAESEDLKLEMDTETLVAAGDGEGEKVNVLEQDTAVPDEIVFEKPAVEVPTTVITTTTTTTTTADGTVTTAPVIDPAVGAEHYVVNVTVIEGTATVTIQCDYADIYMLNGEFVFSYPTDKVVLVGSKWNRGGDRVFLPSATVRVDEEAGTVTLAFMTSDGGEFQDGLVNMLDLMFQAKDADLEEFPLTMECATLRAWEEDNAVGKDMLAAGEMPTKLSWMISMEETPVQEPEQPKALLGDVNGDEKVDSTDARVTLQYAVKKIAADKLDITVADVNGDGKVDSTDARVILQYAVRKITAFPAAA